jgi:ribonuclease HI
MFRESYPAEAQWSFVNRVQRLLSELPNGEELNIKEAHLMYCPPWRTLQMGICPFVSDGLKVGPIEAIKSKFLRHMEEHNCTVFVFTDGSKSQTGVGSAVLIPSLGLSDQRALHTIGTALSCRYRLQAILMAIHLVKMLPMSSFTIFCDSKSVLMSIPKANHFHPLVSEIQSWLFKISTIYKKKIEFCWVPGHCGVQNNELVDNLAKGAVGLTNGDNTIPFSDIIPALTRCAHECWQRSWNTQVNNRLFKIKPKLKYWNYSSQYNRTQEVILCRLRIGHTRLTHGYLMAKENPPYCMTCHALLTVDHIFSECRLIENIRLKHFPSVRYIPHDQRLKHILSESENFNFKRHWTSWGRSI